MNKLPTGFTLIELLIVLAIISILAVLGTYGFTSALKISRDTKRAADLKVIQAALEQYHNDQHYYPPQSINFTPGMQLTNASGMPAVPVTPVTKIYLNNIPVDPTAANVYSYSSYRSQAGDSCAPPPASNSCQFYCLYAVMEMGTAMSNLCPDRAGYNLEVPPP